MNRRYSGSMIAIALLGVFFAITGVTPVRGGIISDAKFVMNNGAAMVSHSRNITSGVRELYRERQSVRSFIESAATLIKAYRSLSANKSANIPQIIEIAGAIDTLVREYNNVGPKASAVFGRIKPDLKFFESMQEVKNVQVGRQGESLQIRTIPDGSVGKLAGLSGWSRVFDAIKEKPSNLFRWGRLRDEYSLGKAEGQLALKACQIAMEGMSYYDEANRSLTELLDIRKQINGIMGGNLTAILNAGTTINKIQSAGGSVERLSGLIESATPRFNQRFAELATAQDAYLKIHQVYRQKYNPQPVTTTGSTAATTSATSAAPRTGAAAGPAATTGTDLRTAMAAYQKAYQEYTACAQDSNVTQQQVDTALRNLRAARDEYERAKAAAK
ncbi:MAG TPA: hypothetical protein PLP29_16365 [Candidatus Ozemobacteraceae bacterium]|nr:hypothetical protein [Candidatus Ozemobacteraceae bacterium]